MTRLELSAPSPDERATQVLRRSTLAARNRGDLQSAALSAGFYAKKQGHTMYIYSGNSFGHAVWRVSDKRGEYLNPINNTGDVVYSVTPDLACSKHQVIRPDTELEPNADHSTHPTVVEYGVQEMFKKKSPAAAARSTQKKLAGSSNVFISAGEPIEIDADELEEALWQRMVSFARNALKSIKPGKEDFAILGTLDHFSQKEALAPELRQRVFADTLTPNAEYFVWRIEKPQREPQGPLDRRGAINDARIVAMGGRHDTAVSIGRDPSAPSFEVIRHFEARTGERLK